MSAIKEILSSTENRQYPLPQKMWKYFQEWHNTIFFHWKVPAGFLEDYIPKELILDQLDNCAWVSLVAFEVKNMRPRYLPAFPYISCFQEINLRTYVIKDGIPGIYMLSIETDKLIEVFLTRFLIGLPYHKSSIKRSAGRLCSTNKHLNHLLDIEIGQRTPILKKVPLYFWLTERHCLYEYCGKNICRFNIHHKQWKLENAEITINDLFYKAGTYNLINSPDIIHYSDKIEVLLWGKEKT